VLCGALVWERIIPGCISVDHGARADFIDEDFTLDRGGAINVISPKGLTSKHAGGQATSGYLAEVERVSMAQMEEWRTTYPEAFARDYDPASGLRFNSWIVEGR
jgi:trimethylamine-N-oxide reductase (cytochrome c)